MLHNSTLPSGGRGRRFESSHSDQQKVPQLQPSRLAAGQSSDTEQHGNSGAISGATTEMRCEARQYSDCLHCARCRLTWDAGESPPSACRPVGTTPQDFDMRLWRTDLDLSQADAADLLGLSHAGYQQIENRVVPMAPRTVFACLYISGEASRDGLADLRRRAGVAA